MLKDDINKIIQNIERSMANGVDFGKYIKQLRGYNALDNLLKIKVVIGNSKPTEKYTLLMFFVIKNNFGEVKQLLEGKNPANPLTVNKVGESALYLAVLCACTVEGYDLRIIDELLKYSPEQQVALQITTGETPLFLAVEKKNLNIVKKLAFINNNEQFIKQAKVTAITPLCYAVEKGLPVSIIQELLNYFPDEQVLCTNKQGMTPLDWALYRGNLEVAQILLKFNPEAQLNHFTKQNITTLHSALASKNYEVIKWLIQNYPFCISLISPDNVTPLYYACSQVNDVKVIKLLLDNGADSQIMTPINNKKTKFIPLSAAVKNDNTEIIEELLKYDANIQLLYEESEGYTAISSACYYGSLKALNILLQKANVNIRNRMLLKTNHNGLTPLHIVIDNLEKLKQAIAEQLIEALLKYNTNEQLEATDVEDKRTPLFIAVEKNNINFVKKITSYSNESQFLKPNKQGFIPLHCAIQESTQEGYPDIINILLSKCPDKQLKTYFEGWLPIHFAAKLSTLGILLKLIKYGDSEQLLVKATEGRTPLHLAADTGQSQKLIIQALLNRYNLSRLIADDNDLLPIHYACQSGDIEIIEIFLQKETIKQLFAKTKSGTIPLHSSVIAGKTNAVNFILKNYQDKMKELLAVSDEQQCTALHLACFYGHLEIVKLLIDNRANINASDINGWQPLHIACFKGYVDIIHYLIKNNADLNAINNLKATPLHIACEQGYLNIVTELVKLDVELNAKDHYGRTSLVCAVALGYTDIVEILAEKGAQVDIAIEIDGYTITPLRIAVENLDLEMVQILAKYQANPDQVLKDGNGTITLFDIVKNFVDDPELEPLFLEKLKRTVVNKISENKEHTHHVEIPSLERRELSSRKYLESIGYTKEQIQEWDEERKGIKITLKKKLSASPNIETSKITNIEYTWFNKLFSSNHGSILPIITTNDKENFYCYLDKKLLQAQGCNIDEFNISRIKFGHKHIKKLDDAKGIYKSLVKFPDCENEIKYTHELKINKVDRILLFEFPSDNKDACLYIGTQYISEGLHVKAKIKSIELSGKTSGALEVNWPNKDLAQVQKMQPTAEIIHNREKLSNSPKDTITYSIPQTFMPPPIPSSIQPAKGSQQQLSSEEDKNIIPRPFDPYSMER